MVLGLSIIFANLFCSVFYCELGANPPFIYVRNKESNRLIPNASLRGRSLIKGEGPLVYTSLGTILGYRLKINKSRGVFAFTGVPYGEPPVGKLRFGNPVPRKPWKKHNVWQATFPSPFCIQPDLSAGGITTGQEDCLYLDVYTPKIPSQDTIDEGPGLPVIIWIPGGSFLNGRSHFYGPLYFMREDVVLVNINVRLGAFGFLSTGNADCPGNWGLKDQALAVEWVYNNIKAFGGDPNRIVIGGISSGSISAQLMLYTRHPSRNLIKGVIALSGSVFANIGLDTIGRTKLASDIFAKACGCPSSERSGDMMDCLRNMNAYDLASFQLTPLITLPPLSFLMRPVLEPNVTGAFLTDLPEDMYERGEVPSIPLIVSKTDDEMSLIMQATWPIQLPSIISLFWKEWGPNFLRTVGYRVSPAPKPTSEREIMNNLQKISKFYFNRNTPPLLYDRARLRQLADIINDNAYHAPVIKLIEKHHTVAPTYAYIMRHHALGAAPAINALSLLPPIRFGAPHASDYAMLFNNTHSIPLFKPGSDFDKASRNLIHLFVNFAAHGEPKYRTASGELTSPWKPIINMNTSLVLDVGLVNQIKMVRDLLFNSDRIKFWDTAIPNEIKSLSLFLTVT